MVFNRHKFFTRRIPQQFKPAPTIYKSLPPTNPSHLQIPPTAPPYPLYEPPNLKKLLSMILVLGTKGSEISQSTGKFTLFDDGGRKHNTTFQLQKGKHFTNLPKRMHIPVQKLNAKTKQFFRGGRKPLPKTIQNLRLYSHKCRTIFFWSVSGALENNLEHHTACFFHPWARRP